MRTVARKQHGGAACLAQSAPDEFPASLSSPICSTTLWLLVFVLQKILNNLWATSRVVQSFCLVRSCSSLSRCHNAAKRGPWRLGSFLPLALSLIKQLVSIIKLARDWLKRRIPWMLSTLWSGFVIKWSLCLVNYFLTLWFPTFWRFFVTQKSF